MDRLYFPLSKLDELEKEFKTVPVDGEGQQIPVDYNENFVRGTVLKLIADVRHLTYELDTERTGRKHFQKENERLQIQAGINVDIGSALIMSQEEIEKLRAVNSTVSKLNGEYKEEIVVLRDKLVQLHDDNFKLKEEIERLIWINEGLSNAELKAGEFKEALHKAIHVLQWYAEEDNYDFHGRHSIPILDDNGKRADKELHKIREELYKEGESK